MDVGFNHRRFRRAVVCAIVIGASPGAALAQSSAVLPPCPTVEASLSETIDTKKVKPGERFTFATTEALANGAATIPAGATGVGLIATSDHSKSQGHSGYLVLEARYIRLPDGSHLPVAFRPGPDGHAQAFVRAGSSSAGALGYLPYYIGTAAGVYDAFHHGKDAAVVAGTHFALVVGDGAYEGTCAP